MAGTIFINYRREDSTATAGRLHDRLAQAFGRKNLFMDVDHIPAGVDFVAHLNSQVAACDVVLVVIGPNWLRVKDKAGQRRLHQPDDFVAIEIAAALARNIRVIPVLVDGARMPKESALPDSLKQLARRQAVEVRHSQFGRDVEALIKKLQPRPWRPGTALAGAAAAVLLLAGWIGLHQLGVPIWVPWSQDLRQAAETRRQADEAEQSRVAALKAEGERRAKAAAEAETRRQADEAEQQRLAALKAEEERKAKAASEAEAKRKAEEAEQQRLAALKAEEDRQARAAAEAEAKRKAEQAEQQRLAALKAEQERKAKADAEAEAKRRAEEAERQRLAAIEAERQRKAKAEADAEAQRKAADALADPKAAQERRSQDLVRSGIEHHNKGNYDRAIADYSEAIRLDPKYAFAHYSRGNAYYAKGDYDRAIANYSEAIKFDPKFADAYLNRGYAYRVKGDNDRATADLDTAKGRAEEAERQRLAAVEAEWWQRKAKAEADAEAQRKAADALADPKAAQERRSQDLVRSGIEHHNKGDYDRAIADYSEAIRLDPKYAFAHYSRGNAYYAKGDYDRAIANYSEAIKFDPKFADAYLNRGYAYRVKGDNDRATADLDTAQDVRRAK